MNEYIETVQSKLHGLKVTKADLNYTGSITLPRKLVKAAGLWGGQKVQVLNVNNGERFETYILIGTNVGNPVEINGAAARKVQVGDELIVIAYQYYNKKFTPVGENIPYNVFFFGNHAKKIDINFHIPVADSYFNGSWLQKAIT